MARSLVSKVGAALALALVLTSPLTSPLACTSPTLPLPPPTAPSISTGTEPEHVKLVSTQGAEPNALIVVVNRNLDLPRGKRVAGTLADEQGSWELEVFASPGDYLDISQESGTTRSPTTTVQVR